MLNGFKNFLLRGNMIDLAIAVVIGVAFGALVKSTVEDLVTPLIGIVGKEDFSSLSFTVSGSTFRYGEFINSLTAFLIIAAVVYFLIILPMNRLISRTRTQT